MTEAAIDHPVRRRIGVCALIAMPECLTGCIRSDDQSWRNDVERVQLTVIAGGKIGAHAIALSVGAWGNKTIDQSPANNPTKLDRREMDTALFNRNGIGITVGTRNQTTGVRNCTPSVAGAK